MSGLARRPTARRKPGQAAQPLTEAAALNRRARGRLQAFKTVAPAAAQRGGALRVKSEFQETARDPIGRFLFRWPDFRQKRPSFVDKSREVA